MTTNSQYTKNQITMAFSAAMLTNLELQDLPIFPKLIDRMQKLLTIESADSHHLNVQTGVVVNEALDNLCKDIEQTLTERGIEFK